MFFCFFCFLHFSRFSTSSWTSLSSFVLLLFLFFNFCNTWFVSRFLSFFCLKFKLIFLFLVRIKAIFYSFLFSFRKQPPRHNAELSVRRGIPSWKLPICSLIFEMASWKIVICLVAKKVFLKISTCSVAKKKCSWKICIWSVNT